MKGREGFGGDFGITVAVKSLERICRQLGKF